MPLDLPTTSNVTPTATATSASAPTTSPVLRVRASVGGDAGYVGGAAADGDSPDGGSIPDGGIPTADGDGGVICGVGWPAPDAEIRGPPRVDSGRH